MPAQGSVHNGQRAPHQTLGTRTRCRGRADAARSEPASHACAPRNRRASVWHAEDADGGAALSDEDAAEGGGRDGDARARLQPHARDEHRRYQTAPRPDPCVQNSRTRLPPWVSDGELAVCAPAPVTRIFGTVSEACFAGSHSPWPPPLAPPAPQWPKPPCSSASQLLWRSLTSRDRASSATAPRLPDADRRLLPNGRSRDLPVPVQGASAHARVSDHAGSSWRSR